MFKKLLILFIFPTAFIQPVYSNTNVDDEFGARLVELIVIVTSKYNQGEKEPFLELEKMLKNDLKERNNSDEFNIFPHFILSQMYIETNQYKKAKFHQEALIDIQKNNGVKDSDLFDDYLRLSFILYRDGNKAKAKEYAGSVCDNGEQRGCKMYRELNE